MSSSRSVSFLEIWEGVLGRSLVTPDDTFIGSGGDSVSAVKVSWLMKQEMGVELSPLDIISGGSFAALSATIETAAASADEVK